MIDSRITEVFRQGSKTYFNSSIFFPQDIKKDVFSLYGFVRKADDFVDAMPQQTQNYEDFKHSFYRAEDSGHSEDVIIDSFVNLSHEKGFKTNWVDSFFEAMEMDLHNREYSTMPEVLEYVYGSAEVVGLMMARIMKLPSAADHYARTLGRAMQYINFIRDTKEDALMGRCYYPRKDLEQCGFSSLNSETASKNPSSFRAFVSRQLDYYEKWQEEGEAGFRYLRPSILAPVKTASDMYKWTARQIRNDPFIVFRKKIRPSSLRVISQSLVNRISLACGAR